MTVFRYDGETGHLFWTNDTSVPPRVRGKRALGARSGSGYYFGSLDGRYLQSHRVIWKLATGVDPEEIDHIDGDQSNNRLSNLRSVSHQQNCRTRGVYATNTSGTTGVSWIEREQKWMASIHADGKAHNLGLYASKDAAIAARTIAEQTLGYNVRGAYV